MNDARRDRRYTAAQNPSDCAKYAALHLFTWGHPLDAPDDWLPAVEQVIAESCALTGVRPSQHDARLAIGWVGSLRATDRKRE